jgi:hypothetical protein
VSSPTSFDGLGVGGGYTPNAAPPDPNGAVGLTQYVQWVNESFAVYDKSTGVRLYGPAAGNTLFQALGSTHPCAVNNDGDPIAQYDKAAGRWVMTQLSVTNGGNVGYWECVAVSKTSDAVTGGWNVYAFPFGTVNFNDYPKLGVWGDNYYTTFNIFAYGRFFTGPRLCAYDRAGMLAGNATVNQVCFQLSSSFDSLLPGDIDGTTAPPAGTPEYFVNFATNSLNVWTLGNVNFTTGLGTLSGPTNIPVAAFSPACNGGTCIPQLGTGQQLDSLGDRLMYRLAYRNFGDHASLVVNHSVTAGTSVGVRWYELRVPGGSAAGTIPSVYQQGTYAPDSDFRWMGSAAMDQAGNLAIGYSASSAAIHPAIRFTGRAPGDPLGTLGAEVSIIEGTGSQLSNLNRWGDYSSISVDPVDDCTFWYTNEFLLMNGTFNWSTRIANFKFTSCGVPVPPGPPAAPTNLTATAGNAKVSLNWTGSAGATSYDVYRSTTSGGYTTLPLAIGITATSYTDSSLSNGTTYYYVVSAVNSFGESQKSNEVSATPQAPPDFALSASPASASVSRGSSAIYTTTVTAMNGFAGTVTFSVSGLPPRSSASFNPSSVTGSGSSTLTVATRSKTPGGTYSLTITATSGNLIHKVTVYLSVN